MRAVLMIVGASKLKYFKLLAIGLVFIASNANADILDMAHKAGFTGCDSAISERFSFYIKAGVGRVTTDHFNNGKSYSIMVTYGDQGDPVMQRAVFEKDGAKCNSYDTSMITSKLSCIAYKEENPVWKYIASQGDFTWTQNSGGVDALLLALPSGGCGVIFNINNSYPADAKSTPSNTKNPAKGAKK